ncbi:MAG: copper(I)-binding protein [Halieaceae bacterium]|jgi:copper(I)-binding protein
MIRFILLMCGCVIGSAWADSTLTVEGAWLRATPPGQQMAAGYMGLINSGTTVITVVGVTTDVAAHAEIHRSTTQDGMSGMRPAGPVSIAAGSHYLLQPGGSHLMLMGVKDALVEGDSIDIALLLGDGTTLLLTVPVHRTAPGVHK